MKWLIRAMTLLLSLTQTKGDDTVTCLYTQDCLLPCQSSYHDVIHWQKVNGDKTPNVHSFYGGSDKLDHQDEAYRERTSLFSDQISKGNISLILKGVKIQDRGRYKCYTAVTFANREAFVNVKVMAPFKSVDIKMTNEGITCNTSKVYPEPRISWTTVGTPQNMDHKKHVDSETQEDSQGLFSLVSTLAAKPDQYNFTYTCTISFEDGVETYRASLTNEKTEIDSGEDMIVYCPESQGDTGNFTLVLTFEDSSTILSYNSQTTQQETKHWNGIDVKITREGNIALHKLDSKKHAGMYTCERITTKSRQLMQTSVQIKSASTVAISIVIVLIVVVAVGAIAAILIYRNKKGKQQKSTSKKENERKDRGTKRAKENTAY